MKRKGFNERYGKQTAEDINRAALSSGHNTEKSSDVPQTKEMSYDDSSTNPALKQAEGSGTAKHLQEQAEAYEDDQINVQTDMAESMDSYEEGLLKYGRNNSFETPTGLSPKEQYQKKRKPPLNKPIEKVKEGDVSSLTSRKVVYGAARNSMLDKQARNLEIYKQQQSTIPTSSLDEDNKDTATNTDTDKPYQLTPDMRVDPSPWKTVPTKAEILKKLPKSDWQVAAEEIKAAKQGTEPSVESASEVQLFGMTLPQTGPEHIFAVRSFRDALKLHITKEQGEAKQILADIISELEYAPNRGISEEQAQQVAALARRFNTLKTTTDTGTEEVTSEAVATVPSYSEDEAATLFETIENLHATDKQEQDVAYTPEEAEKLVVTVDNILANQTEQPKDDARRSVIAKVDEKPTTTEQSKPGFWRRLFGRFTSKQTEMVAQEKVTRSRLRNSSKALLLVLFTLVADSIPNKIADGTYTPGPTAESEAPKQPPVPRFENGYQPAISSVPGSEIPSYTKTLPPLTNATTLDVSPAINNQTPTQTPSASGEQPSYTFEINEPKEASQAEQMFDIEPRTYTVKEGDRGLSYILLEQYPDIFPPEGSPAWIPVITAWQGDTQLCAEAGFPRSDLNLIKPDDSFQLDVFVKDYLAHFAPDDVRERYIKNSV